MTKENRIKGDFRKDIYKRAYLLSVKMLKCGFLKSFEGCMVEIHDYRDIDSKKNEDKNIEDENNEGKNNKVENPGEKN